MTAIWFPRRTPKSGNIYRSFPFKGKARMGVGCSTAPRGLSMAGFNEDPLSMLHAEIEMLVANETYLKKIAGAGVLFISHLECQNV